MFTSILGAIGGALGPIMRIAADWMDGENSADMVAAKKAANQQAARDRITADVAKGDLTKIGKDIAS